MSESLFDVTGKVALVTGASSGFGAHFAKILSEHGAKVVVAARRLDRLESLVEEIKSNGGEAEAVVLDVTDSESVKHVFDAAEERFGVVEILSNNAGVAIAKFAVELEEKDWDLVLDTNLKGVWLVAQEAGKRMIAANKQGSIVNTASILGLRASIIQAAYASSKAGVVQLTKVLALEWSRHNIRVNALCPGYFATDMNQDYFDTDNGKAYIETMPAKRTGELEELTAPFMLLASDAGSFVNGVALPVDGAHSIGNM